MGLQLGLVVLPCFVKGLLYVLRKQRGGTSANYKEVTAGTHLFAELDLHQQMPHSSHTNLYSGDGLQAATPLVGTPKTVRVHDPVTRHSPLAQHKDTVYSGEIYSAVLCTVLRLLTPPSLRCRLTLNRGMC